MSGTINCVQAQLQQQQQQAAAAVAAQQQQQNPLNGLLPMLTRQFEGEMIRLEQIYQKRNLIGDLMPSVRRRCDGCVFAGRLGQPASVSIATSAATGE